MNYLNKLLLVVLTSLPLLVAMDTQEPEDTHTVTMKLPLNTKLADDTSIADVEGITCLKFVTPNGVILAKLLGFSDSTTPRLIWTSPVLEKLNWGQLLQLTRNLEIGPDEFLLTGIRKAARELFAAVKQKIGLKQD
ncbi:MAG: hypothetical protein WCJ92_02140 [Alphaproteobacteria bacterium]